MNTFTGVAHLAIVVRGIDISVAWYRRSLGFKRAGRVSFGPTGMGRPRQLMRHAASGLVLAVHEPLQRSDDMFDPSRTGLDHFSLAVADHIHLERWVKHFDELGVAHSPLRDAGYAEFITVTDPDGIAWELWAAKPTIERSDT